MIEALEALLTLLVIPLKPLRQDRWFCLMIRNKHDLQASGPINLLIHNRAKNCVHLNTSAIAFVVGSKSFLENAVLIFMVAEYS